ncbi:aspartate kinase [Sinobaca sp. H24]|uniref:aspartate kinase n=1 Tax=Sinobaca sp. H24 TaxID=2923376 RepID=UPI00207A352D|nr:aspartate kinase [Sinobaca sp. H24]
MKVIVQKFGGTSVKDEATRELAAAHVARAVEEGYKVVVVVSAMGRQGDPYATDTLLGLLNQNGSRIGTREKDMLVSVGETISSVIFTELLQSKKLKAAAMTGAQAGFRTDGQYGSARIVDMQTDALVKRLEETDVVVVAGFQGVSGDGELTTLGRGGSDTSATAIGAALQAEYVDIFTDVEGIMTADPRIVEEAEILSSATYQEICNMAYQGAKVIHPRAVEIAMQGKVPIRIRSTASNAPGTLISAIIGGAAGSDRIERQVTGIAHISGVTQVTVEHAEGVAQQAAIFKELAENDISVDFISIQPQRLVFTIPDEKSPDVKALLAAKQLEGSFIHNCAKISAVGAGMTGVPGVVSKIVGALAEQEISILQSADSHTTIWTLVHGEDMNKAVLALHQMFELGRQVKQ